MIIVHDVASRERLLVEIFGSSDPIALVNATLADAMQRTDTEPVAALRSLMRHLRWWPVAALPVAEPGTS